ncbi:unnamed protein product [Caenorhabditis angaria]|uniref:Uncharacterized protein n=1 Tax=Caenorhabditis angaria TaxID=860376 RepID=A0A9P1NA43_9PELO|nr:unnamed protein product [Caenorhabditis angaria]
MFSPKQLEFNILLEVNETSDLHSIPGLHRQDSKHVLTRNGFQCSPKEKIESMWNVEGSLSLAPRGNIGIAPNDHQYVQVRGISDDLAFYDG